MNRVVHFEIHAEDMARAQKFYHDVFGWEMIGMGGEYGDYVVLKSGPGPDELGGKPIAMKDIGINGGMMKANAPRPPKGVGPNAYVCIIGVDDVDAMLKNVIAAGGSEHMAAMDVPNVGRLAYCGDTEGNIFGIIKPKM